MLINDDVIRKICFIEAYAHRYAEILLTQEPYVGRYNVSVVNGKLVTTENKKKRYPFTSLRFPKIKKTIHSRYEQRYDVIMMDGMITHNSHTLALKPCILCDPNDNEAVSSHLMWLLDMMSIYYKYPYMRMKFKEDSIPEIEWKLDALHLYLTMQKGVRDTIISENESVVDDFKSQREETIRQQEEAYANFQKECKIIEEQNKIRERERKKALKEEAKRRMTLEAKMESHEIYGEIRYKGEMHVIKSREDLEQLLKRMS